jgi:hypothetical protein
MLAETDRKAKTEASHNTAFDKWLGNPMTRMGMSMIPAADKDDAVRLLLRSAFDAGCDAGAGSTAGDFMGAILEGMMKEKKSDAR